MPSDLKHQIHTYWQERARAFDDVASHRRDADVWERVLTLAVQDLMKGGRVLDLGAGTGACALLMARLGHQVTAVDLAPAMLERLERQAQAERLEISTIHADVDTLPMPENSLDLVTMRNVLWTLPEPEQLLIRVRKALRPGGRLLVSDGFWNHDAGDDQSDDVHWGLKRFQDLYRPIADKLPFYSGVSTAAVEQLIKAAGFHDFRHWRAHFDPSTYQGVTDDFFLLTAWMNVTAEG